MIYRMKNIMGKYEYLKKKNRKQTEQLKQIL